ncbi:hypothetical protein pb186bvf_016223 [Paramecium bursaria]
MIKQALTYYLQEDQALSFCDFIAPPTKPVARFQIKEKQVLQEYDEKLEQPIIFIKQSSIKDMFRGNSSDKLSKSTCQKTKSSQGDSLKHSPYETDWQEHILKKYYNLNLKSQLQRITNYKSRNRANSLTTNRLYRIHNHTQTERLQKSFC